MARGWESKSVEAQIERAEESRNSARNQTQGELLRKKEGFLLSRARVLRDLQMNLNPRYRDILNSALADLEEKLSKLE